MQYLETITLEPKQTANASIIWLHGLGANGNDFVPIVKELNLPAELNIRFVFPHAPVIPVTINAGMAMPAWFDFYGLNADAKQDEVGIRKAQRDIEALIQREQQRGIASQRIILAGFSQGGAMALHTGLRYPDQLGGILGLSTFLPLHDHVETELQPKQKQTPILLAHGTFDTMVPMSLGELTCRYLVQLGCQVTWRTYPMQHEVCMMEIVDIGQWLVQSLL